MPYSKEYEEGKAQYFETVFNNPYEKGTKESDDFERGYIKVYRLYPNVLKNIEERIKISDRLDNAKREKEKLDYGEKVEKAKSEYLKATGR